MMTAAFQQGEADGLCGIYSVLNFLMQLPGWRECETASAMEDVLVAVQAEGLLAPEYLTRGYQEYHLAAILNRIFASFLMDFKAVQLKEIERHLKEDWIAFYHRVLAQGGSIIGGPKGRDHWVLVTGVNGRTSVINSADPAKPVKAFDKRQPDYCDEEGVAILPHKRPLIKI